MEHKVELNYDDSEIIKMNTSLANTLKNEGESTPAHTIGQLYVIPEEILNPLKLLDLPNEVIRSINSGSSLDVWADEEADSDVTRRSSLISVLSTMYGFEERTDWTSEFKKLVTLMRILTFVLLLFVISIIVFVLFWTN